MTTSLPRRPLRLSRREWSGLVVAALLVGIVALWNFSTSARCTMIQTVGSVGDLLPEIDGPEPGLDSVLLGSVAAVVQAEVDDVKWEDSEGWGSCLRVANLGSVEAVWTAGPPSVGANERVVMPDQANLDPGRYFLLLENWSPDDESVELPAVWWARVVLDSDQTPVAGLDDVAIYELAAIAVDSDGATADTVQTLVEYRLDLLELERAREAAMPYWDVGPRLEALLRFRGEAVRDYIGAPDLEVWLEWDPIDRRLGWTRNHIPEGAAAALDIEWGNGELVVIHHGLTTDTVTHVGLLSSVGLTGPEALVPGGGEVSIRGQYATARPLDLVLFDADGDVALVYPMPESILRAMDSRVAVAVDLDLSGADNWRALDRPPS